MRGALRIRIDMAAPEPAYRQIASQLRSFVVDGSLEPGASLPAVRRLALDLGVHFNTVAEAYRQLAAEGLLDVAHGRSATVASRAAAPATRDEAESLRRRLRHLLAEMRARGIPAKVIKSELGTILEE